VSKHFVYYYILSIFKALHKWQILPCSCLWTALLLNCWVNLLYAVLVHEFKYIKNKKLVYWWGGPNCYRQWTSSCPCPEPLTSMSSVPQTAVRVAGQLTWVVTSSVECWSLWVARETAIDSHCSVVTTVCHTHKATSAKWTNHHHHHAQASSWNVAVSTRCFRCCRSWVYFHAELRPRLRGWRSASRERSQIWRGRPGGRLQSLASLLMETLSALVMSSVVFILATFPKMNNWTYKNPDSKTLVAFFRAL